MSGQPDPSVFSANERPNEYEVRCKVSGTITLTIEAASAEEARAKAEQMAEKEPVEFELTEPDEIEISYVRKSPPMYRVTRDGIPMQVSHLHVGDMPRDPDQKYGF